MAWVPDWVGEYVAIVLWVVLCTEGDTAFGNVWNQRPAKMMADLSRVTEEASAPNRLLPPAPGLGEAVEMKGLRGYIVQAGMVSIGYVAAGATLYR